MKEQFKLFGIALALGLELCVFVVALYFGGIKLFTFVGMNSNTGGTVGAFLGLILWVIHMVFFVKSMDK